MEESKAGNGPSASLRTGRPRWMLPMLARSPEEEHRQASFLELFFDLVFVVAVAQASSGLHHGIAEGDAGDAVRAGRMRASVRQPTGTRSA